MANPKRKLGKNKTRQRRSAWMARMKKGNLSTCPNCGEVKLPHRACPHCGFYKGRQVVVVAAE